MLGIISCYSSLCPCSQMREMGLGGPRVLRGTRRMEAGAELGLHLSLRAAGAPGTRGLCCPLGLGLL